MTTHPEVHDLALDDLVRSLRVALLDSPDAAFVLDRDGQFLMANPALCDSLRVTEASLLGRRFDLSARSTDPRRVEHNLRVALDGAATRYRGTGTRTDGSDFVAEVTHLPLRVDGEVVAVLGTAVDLTEVDRHDVELRRGEDLLKIAGRLARFGGWSIDSTTGRVVLSEGARLMLGIADDVPDIAAAAWERHPEDERARITGLFDACLQRGESFDVESVMVTTTGERLHVRTVGEADRADDGTIVGAHGALLDITESVAARERERALETRLSTTLNSIRDGIVFVDLAGRVTFVNRRTVEMSRRTEEELLGRTFWELFPAAVEAGFRAAFDRAAQTKERVVHRAFYPPHDCWYQATANPTEDGVAIFLRDVTDEEHAENVARATRKQLEQQAALLDTARDAMMVRDLDFRVQYWNRAAEQLYGWTAEEAIGQSVIDLIGMDPEVRERSIARVIADGYFAGEVQQQVRDGRWLTIDCRWQLITDEHGEPQGVFAVNTDITDFRREREGQARAQRLESLGTLSGGIAHDLNNVLTPILMSVQLLGYDEADPDRRELLSTIETAAKRGAEMIRQVLSFARGVEGRRIPVDLDRLLDDVVAFSREVLPPGVTLEVEREPQMPGTLGDPTQLLQVIINLVTNAKDALAGHGRLQISTQSIEVTDEYSSVSHDAKPGSYVVIAVEDDGHGMPVGVSSKIFEPFFTTKAPGKGTGLGLATSLAIVRSHGGFMQVYSEPDRGTRFIVGLPVSTEATTVRTPQGAGRVPLPQGSGELVLVVDDEETIRQVTSRTLLANGYRTVLANNGEEAIGIIERGDEVIDLVLTDMMMPVMDGAATSAYLEMHHPHIPIIAASGLNSGGSPSRSIGMGISHFIAKPYTTRLLLTTVRDTLLEHRSSQENPEEAEAP